MEYCKLFSAKVNRKGLRQKCECDHLVTSICLPPACTCHWTLCTLCSILSLSPFFIWPIQSCTLWHLPDTSSCKAYPCHNRKTWMHFTSSSSPCCLLLSLQQFIFLCDSNLPIPRADGQPSLLQPSPHNCMSFIFPHFTACLSFLVLNLKLPALY